MDGKPKKKKIIKRRAVRGTPSKNRKSRMQKAADQEKKGREKIAAMQKQSELSMQLFKLLQKATKTAREQALEEDPDAGVMPEVVSDRMLGRIGILASIPITIAFALLYGFYYYTTQGTIDVPANYLAYATIALTLLAFAGITFGVLTTQLDEDQEQSFLGFENIRKNWRSIRGIEEEREAKFDDKVLKQEVDRQGMVMTPEQADAARSRIAGEIKPVAGDNKRQ